MAAAFQLLFLLCSFLFTKTQNLPTSTRIPLPVPRLERSPRDGPEGGWPHFLSRVVGERRKRAQSCGPTEVSAEALTASRRLRDAAVWVPPATDGTPAFLWPQPSHHPGVAGLGLRAPGSGPGCTGSAPPAPPPRSQVLLPGPGATRLGRGGGSGVFRGVPLLPGLPPASATPAVRRSPQGCFSGPSHPGPREAHRLSLTPPRVTFHGVRAGRRLGGKGSSPHPD